MPDQPDGDDEAKMDMERRREKVDALLKDFRNEVESRIQKLRLTKTEMMRQIDLAYTVELMRIKPEHRSMKLTDYLAMKKAEKDAALASGSTVLPVSAPQFLNPDDFSKLCLSSAVSSSSSVQMPPIAEDDAAEQPTTTRKTRGKKGADENFVQCSTKQTARRTRTSKNMSLATPANSKLAMMSMATPLVTPKFDTRLYHTAAVTKRAAKPGEVIMSIDGSPVDFSDKSTASRAKSIVVLEPSELENLDAETAQTMMRQIDDMKRQLQTVLN